MLRVFISCFTVSDWKRFIRSHSKRFQIYNLSLTCELRGKHSLLNTGTIWDIPFFAQGILLLSSKIRWIWCFGKCYIRVFFVSSPFVILRMNKSVHVRDNVCLLCLAKVQPTEMASLRSYALLSWRSAADNQAAFSMIIHMRLLSRRKVRFVAVCIDIFILTRFVVFSCVTLRVGRFVIPNCCHPIVSSKLSPFGYFGRVKPNALETLLKWIIWMKLSKNTGHVVV